MYLRLGTGQYFLVTFLDEYSRYLVHWELLTTMDGQAVSLAAQAAIDTLPKTAEGKVAQPPEIRSDNGSCYISREFRQVLEANDLAHQRIKPHCPEEKDYASRCTSSVHSGAMLRSRRGSVSLIPWCFIGRSSRGGSYKHSFLSL